MKYDFMLNGIPTKPGIYMWRNKLNDKRYIGQAVNLYNRIKSHLESFEANKQHKYLYYAINKDGIENFEITIVEIIDIPDKEVLDQKEIFYIKEYNCIECGYNRTTGGDGGEFGCFCCKETQELQRKISIELRNRQREEGMFSFFIWDLKTKKLYTCNSIEKGCSVLKTSKDNLRRAISGYVKVHGRFVLGKTLQDIKDRIQTKGTSDIRAMISYLKEHPEKTNIEIAKHCSVSYTTVVKYRKELGLYEPRPIYRITKGNEKYEGPYSKCAEVIGVNPSTLYRNLSTYLNKEYRGWLIERI